MFCAIRDKSSIKNNVYAKGIKFFKSLRFIKNMEIAELERSQCVHLFVWFYTNMYKNLFFLYFIKT